MLKKILVCVMVISLGAEAIIGCVAVTKMNKKYREMSNHAQVLVYEYLDNMDAELTSDIDVDKRHGYDDRVSFEYVMSDGTEYTVTYSIKNLYDATKEEV